MNRKNAFTAVVVLPRKMVIKRAYSSINVMAVGSNFQVVIDKVTHLYGRRIVRENKLIHN